MSEDSLEPQSELGAVATVEPLDAGAAAVQALGGPAASAAAVEREPPREPPPAPEPPLVTDSGVRFRLPDPDHALAAVSLVQEVAWPRSGPELAREGAHWLVDFARPPVDRMEYLFELIHEDGRSEVIADPSNPERAFGPFGAKSVVEFPGYARPAWIEAQPDADPLHGAVTELELPSAALGGVLRALLWASPGTEPDARLPLLVALDGIEYGEFAGLTRFLDWATGAGELPAMRAALLHPVRRDETYAAAPEHAEAMARELLPALDELAPVAPGRRMRVGMGASLGALAMLHCHRARPESFGGLFLQSGSFFRHRYDRFGLGLPQLDRIWAFVGDVGSAARWDAPVPLVIDCGTVEQNLANNRAMALVLRHQGYPVAFGTFRDGHNWTAWRDDFHPRLTRLLAELWR